MSITGLGILGSLGWGTTTSQALEQQAEEVSASFARVEDLMKGHSPFSSDVKQPDPLFCAMVMSKREYEWPEEKKQKFFQQRRERPTMTEEMEREIQEWQQLQKECIQKRQQAFSTLDAVQQRTVHALAECISEVVISMHMREALIYPLARDHLESGEKLFASAVDKNDRVRADLALVREVIADNLSNGSWATHFQNARTTWNECWQWERQSIVEPLAKWIPTARYPDFAEADGVPRPDNANHDLNYGQQLVQIREMLSINYHRSGYLQGIPRSRQQPDWTCDDGLLPVPKVSLDVPKLWQAENIVPPGEPKMHDVPSGLGKAEGVEVPDIHQLEVSQQPVRLDTLPDAQSKEERKEMEELQKSEIKESQQAIEQAHKASHGNKVLEKLENLPHAAMETVDKARSYFDWLSSSKHTHDIEGSFNKVEVNLAFRNHGTHFETLKRDITPIGNHYLLIHFDVQDLSPQDYRLKVYGCVDNPLEFTLDAIKNMGKQAIIRQPSVMECSGNGRTLMKPRFNHHVPWELQAFGCYIWTGIPLRAIIDQVKPTGKAVDIVFTGYDAGVQENSLRHYQRAVGIDDPIVNYMMVCWENNGSPLLREHGFPLRIMTPGWYGDNNVKWLQSINFVDHKFKGRHMVSYSYTKEHFDKDIAVPSQEIRPRAMINPMGYPAFMERNRYLLAGTHTWEGKAWVGGGVHRSVVAVELSVDGGKTWGRCRLEPRTGIFGWHRFTCTLTLSVGMYDVIIRSTDNHGHRQKVQLGPEDWNWHGMCDDACQTVKLVVVDKLTFTT